MKMFQHVVVLVTVAAWSSASLYGPRPDYVQVPAQCGALRGDVHALLTEVGAVRAALQEGALNPQATLDNQMAQMVNSNNLSFGVDVIRGLATVTFEEMRSNQVVQLESLQSTMVTLVGALELLADDVSNLRDGQKELLQSLQMTAAALQADQDGLLRELRAVKDQRRDVLDLLQREAQAKAHLGADLTELANVLGNLKPCLENMCYASNFYGILNYGRHACLEPFCRSLAK